MKSYSYYKNLGFENFEFWSEDDLSNFLIWDFLNGYSAQIFGKDILESFLIRSQFFVNKSNEWKKIFSIIDNIYLKLILLFRGNTKRQRILFLNSKNFPVIKGLKEEYLLSFIVQGGKDRILAVENFIPYISTNDLTPYVLKYLKEKDIEYLRQLVKKIEERLKIINPNYIILASDLLPVERAIILAGKKIGTITIEIQHGIYMDTLAEPLEFYGGAADYILVWGEYFKNLHIKHGTREAKDIFVLGYPYKIEKNDGINKNNNQRTTLCYLSQNYEMYSGDFLPIKIETIERISEICKRVGLKFICRPHPGDDVNLLRESLPDILFTPRKEKLWQTFQRADIFVGFSSTSLIEATMAGKISLQIMNYPVQIDNFEKLGVCGKSLETFAELENYLIKIFNTTNLDVFKIKFNNSYIQTKYNPGRRIQEILKEIKNDNK